MKTQEAFEAPKTMHSLDNPIWNSLSALHAHFAEGDEFAKRYPDAKVARSEREVLEDASINGAQGILLNITGSTLLTLHEVHEASSIVQQACRISPRS